MCNSALSFGLESKGCEPRILDSDGKIITKDSNKQ